MWLSSMWTMSSARDSNWRPQPPNLQELEKKDAAAMPVMLSALVHSPGGGGFRGVGAVNEEAEASGPGWERGRARSGEADTGRPDRTAADAAGRQAGQRGWGWGGGGVQRAGWWQPTSRPAYLLGYECDVWYKAYLDKSKLAHQRHI